MTTELISRFSERIRALFAYDEYAVNMDDAPLRDMLAELLAADRPASASPEGPVEVCATCGIMIPGEPFYCRPCAEDIQPDAASPGPSPDLRAQKLREGGGS